MRSGARPPDAGGVVSGKEKVRSPVLPATSTCSLLAALASLSVADITIVPA